MDSNAWPQIRKSRSSGLLRPVKRPRIDSSSEADQPDEPEHRARKFAPSAGFADIVSGLDFKLGLQNKTRGLGTTRALTTPTKVDVLKPPMELQRSAQRTRQNTPSKPQGVMENISGPSREGQTSAAKDTTVSTPMRPPPFPAIQGNNRNHTSFLHKSGLATPSAPRIAQGQSSPTSMSTPTVFRIPPFQLSKPRNSLSTPLKKAVPFKLLRVPEPAGPSSLNPVTGASHSITETKAALENALARERDKGKCKTKEMKAMSEVKVGIDWSDGDLMRGMIDAHSGSSDVENAGKEMRELRRGLLVSPEKGGRGAKKGKFVRGGLAEAAQQLISRSQTDHVLWSREIEHTTKSSTTTDPHSTQCDARLRIQRILNVRRTHSKSNGSAARSILAECEVLEADSRSVFDIDGSFTSDRTRRVVAAPPWVPQQIATPPPIVRVLFSIAPENAISASSALFVPVYSINPIPAGAEVCVWKPWYSVSSDSAQRDVKSRSCTVEGSNAANLNPGLTIFCSRFLVVPLARRDKGT